MVFFVIDMLKFVFILGKELVVGVMLIIWWLRVVGYERDWDDWMWVCYYGGKCRFVYKWII